MYMCLEVLIIAIIVQSTLLITKLQKVIILLLLNFETPWSNNALNTNSFLRGCGGKTQ